MAEIIVLMVAEKPSIASTLAASLSQGASVNKRKGVSPSSPVYEYSGEFRGHAARFRVTATIGHIYSLDFSSESSDWTKVKPSDLFEAPVVRMHDQRSRMPEHIAAEAKGADVVVLWLDCDREGENICFEVIELALPHMKHRNSWPGAYEGCVYRAHFSSLSAVDLVQAMANLGQPDINQSHSVDTRQEIDLRLGVAFSRLQTSYFRTHFGNQLGKKMVSYGPCQFPTLWFCVQRHCQIEAFVPVPFWHLSLTVTLEGQTLSCQHFGGEMWDGTEARMKMEALRSVDQSATVQSTQSWKSRYTRPLPLNTVAMLKMASRELGIGPGDTMHYAEQLYLKGVLSYPRTETAKYPENLDLEETARLVSAGTARWYEYTRNLLLSGLTEPRGDGTDAGDHPPITPVKMATVAQCGGAVGWALFSAICTHFLATISPDGIFEEAEMNLLFGG
jgi:DNA topoisomerase III